MLTALYEGSTPSFFAAMKSDDVMPAVWSVAGENTEGVPAASYG